MSKAKLIADTVVEIQKIQTYLFDDFKANLLKNGVGANESIIQAIDVLRNETFNSYTAKKLTIESEYLKKLKILSILTHFFGCQSYDLAKLSRQLSTNKQECINLLLEASINKLVSIKIDEQSNKILIINSKIRQRETGFETKKLCQGKLVQIKQKNNDVENNICNLIRIVRPEQAQVSIKDKKFTWKFQ